MADKFTINIGNKKIVIDAKVLKNKEFNTSATNDTFINTVFNAYDTNGEKGLQKKEVNSIIKDLKKAAGKDNVLTEEEGKNFLSSLGLDISEEKQYGEFIEHIGNLANAAESGVDENGKNFTRQTSVSDKGVVTRIDTYEDGTYQKYENDKLVSGKDEKGEYKITGGDSINPYSHETVEIYKTYQKPDGTKEIYAKNGKLFATKDKNNDTYYYTYTGNKTIISRNCSSNALKEIETLDNGKTITREYSYPRGGVRETTVTDENGAKSKTTEYLDDYMFNHAIESVGMYMKDLKKILEPKITSDTLSSFKYYGDRLVETLANTPDNFDKEKYITGVIDKLDEYAKLANVSTKELDNIKTQIKSKGFENVPINDIIQSYQTVFNRFDKADLQINSNNKISNSYYKSDNNYTKYSSNNAVTVVDNSTGKKTTINLDKMLKPLSSEERDILQKAIKSLPAECLLDLNIEATFTNMKVTQGADGDYRNDSDTIQLRSGDYSRETLVHELGHAIDAKGTNGFQTDTDKAFVQAFEEEMKSYTAAGNKRVTLTKSGYQNWNEAGSNYATFDRQEMFAECYCMLMLGDNQSAEIIKKYFPKTLEASKNLLNRIRQQPDNVRHKS